MNGGALILVKTILPWKDGFLDTIPFWIPVFFKFYIMNLWFRRTKKGNKHIRIRGLNRLVPEATKCKLELEKCILCHNVKDNRGDKKLTSTGNGRKTFEERLKSCGVGSRVNHGLNNMLTPATQSQFFNVTYFNVISDTWRKYNLALRRRYPYSQVPWAWCLWKTDIIV